MASVGTQTSGIGNDFRHQENVLNDRTDLVDLLDKVDIAYVTVGSGNTQAGCAWVRSAFFPKKIRRYDVCERVSRNRIHLQILFIISNRPDVAIKAIDNNDEHVSEFIKIACVPSLKSGEGTRMLLGGFDDVFDLNKISGAEARARVDAILLRYAYVRTSNALMREHKKRLSAMAPLDDLTNRELAILHRLAKSERTVVSYRAIIDFIEAPGQSISLKNLSVTVSGLRKKLKAGSQIGAVRGEGYILTRHPQDGSEPMRIGI